MPDQRVGAALRRVVQARARDLCEYCRCPAQFATQSFTVEHIVPRDIGGETALHNLAWACFGCNGHKHTSTHGVDPHTGERVALFHPRTHRWWDHFAWSADFTRIEGKTPLGRATIEVIRLNRPGIVNLRRVLAAGGLHPPSEPDPLGEDP
ncbi:MAG: HNH endonuclease [Polyangiaceae bacterium]|nr:HNH endonuclease [Polyangiaceae bacterium]